jgi:hypothetical protein
MWGARGCVAWAGSVNWVLVVSFGPYTHVHADRLEVFFIEKDYGVVDFQIRWTWSTHTHTHTFMLIDWRCSSLDRLESSCWSIGGVLRWIDWKAHADRLEVFFIEKELWGAYMVDFHIRWTWSTHTHVHADHRLERVFFVEKDYGVLVNFHIRWQWSIGEGVLRWERLWAG